MNLYLLNYDDMPFFVEASSFSDAIRIWRVWMARENEEGDPPFVDEPEELTIISDEPVIREARQ